MALSTQNITLVLITFYLEEINVVTSEFGKHSISHQTAMTLDIVCGNCRWITLYFPWS